ncbi:MAG: hypothetical protein AABZ60_03460 [Planctomycetota bacterium]
MGSYDRWRARFKIIIRVNLALCILILYLNFFLNLYASEQKIKKLQQDQQHLLVSFQKIQEQNQHLKLRLQAKDDPYYVEFLLRKKLKMKRNTETSIPLNLKEFPLLLME